MGQKRNLCSYFVAAFEFLVFSHILIALCAAGQGLLTFILLQRPTIYWPILCILFFATLFTYNFRVILHYSRLNDAGASSKRVAWIARHKLASSVIGIIALFAVVPFIFYLHLRTIIPLLVLGVLTIAYSFPFLQSKSAGLRQVPILKIFLIALIWASSSVLLPVMEIAPDLAPNRLLMLLAKRFIFVLALTLPFDIWDIKTDRIHKLITFATLLGERWTKTLSIALLLIDLALVYIFDYHLDVAVFSGLWTTFLIASAFVVYATSRRSDFYYLFFMDGLMLLQPCLIFAFRLFL